MPLSVRVMKTLTINHFTATPQLYLRLVKPRGWFLFLLSPFSFFFLSLAGRFFFSLHLSLNGSFILSQQILSISLDRSLNKFISGHISQTVFCKKTWHTDSCSLSFSKVELELLAVCWHLRHVTCWWHSASLPLSTFSFYFHPSIPFFIFSVICIFFTH